MDPHASVWPLELGLWPPTLLCGPLSWGYGLLVGLAELGQWTTTLWACRVGDMDSHASVCLDLATRTPHFSMASQLCYHKEGPYQDRPPLCPFRL